jgi:hypothetical protein
MRESDFFLLLTSIALSFLFMGLEVVAVLAAGEMVVEKIEKIVAILRGLILF